MAGAKKCAGGGMNLSMPDPVWQPWTTASGITHSQTVSWKYETPLDTVDLTTDQPYIWGPSESEYSSDGSAGASSSSSLLCSTKSASIKLSQPKTSQPQSSQTKTSQTNLSNTTKSASTKLPNAKSSKTKPASTESSSKGPSSTKLSSRPNTKSSITSGIKASGIKSSTASGTKLSTTPASPVPKSCSTNSSTTSGAKCTPEPSTKSSTASGPKSSSTRSSCLSSSSGATGSRSSSPGSSSSVSSGPSLHLQPVPDRFPWKEDKRWPSRQRKPAVQFLNGTLEQKSLVRSVVKENYNAIPMRIRFSFLSSRETGPSNVRIKFIDSGISWADIGMGKANQQPNEPTMELNLGNKKTAEDKVGNILHEFGHVLGLRHEHQHPDSGLVFCRRQLREEGYGDDDITEQWLPFGFDKRRTEPYDRESIMHYSITTKEAKNLKSPIGRSNALSRGDKNQLIAMYPPEKTATTTIKTTHDKAKTTTTTTRKTTDKAKVTTTKKANDKAKPKVSETVPKTRPPLRERSPPNKSTRTGSIKYGGKSYKYPTEYTDSKGRKKKVSSFQQKLMQWIVT
ncbi:uncharacterized protein PG986_008818 [Apiospora aurea]|uniref:Metalloendopeptidase n=1 Tax=Apiospora aurea TaxID=335848 RepID=A0ABR1Q5Z4_9PEZI